MRNAILKGIEWINSNGKPLHFDWRGYPIPKLHNLPQIKYNTADIWWKNKMNLPIGKTGLFKCNTCRYAYASKISLNKHNCKKPKNWKQEWVIDTFENRKQWRRSS